MSSTFNPDLTQTEHRRMRLAALDRILWAVVLLGGCATALSLYQDISIGRFGLPVFYLLLYLVAIVVTVFTRLGYTLRASALVVIIYLLGVSELLLFGLSSLVDMEFLAAVYLAGLFFSLRAGLGMLLGCIASMFLILLAYNHGGIYAYLAERPSDMSLGYMIALMINLVLLTAPGLMMLNVFLSQLSNNLADTRALVGSLQHENEERARAEQSALESEARFRAIYDGVNHAILLHDIESGKIADANRAARDMYGYSMDALREGTLGELNDGDAPHTRDQFEQYLAEAAAAESCTPVFEWRIREKSGTQIWVEVSMQRANVSDTDTVVVTIHDIEFRKQSEAELLQEKRFSEAIVESIPELFMLYDNSFKLLQWNQDLERVTEHPKEALEGRSIWDWDFGKDSPRVKKLLEDAHAKARFVAEATLTTKSGARLPYLFTGTSFERSGKRYLVAIAADLSKLKQAEAEMRMLSTAIEQSAESMVVTDLQGAIQYVNPAFEAITGYSRDEVLGRHPKFLRFDNEHEDTYKALWRALDNGERWNGQLTSRKKDGSQFIEEALISPIRDHSGRVVQHVAVRRDITNEIELENQLRQAQKMEAVGRLAGGVAHDFNNLLQVISGYIAIAMERLGPEDDSHADLAQVENAAERATALVRQLLAFSRREALSLSTINLNDLTSGLLKMVRRVIGENIQLDFEPGESIPHIRADDGQVEQVIMNLCVNARDAMPGGGRICITTRCAQFDAAYCAAHPEAREGDYVALRVADTGDGVPEEIRECVFEPFFTTKGIGEGTGLGLSTVYAVAARHGGFVSLVNAEDGGAVFDVYFKAAEAKPLAAEKRHSVLESLQGKGECILLAEDDNHVRQLATTLLERSNYRVIPASDGIEAIELFDARDGEIDLALLDVVMPGKSGRAVYDHIKAKDPKRPIIFTSGYTHDLLGAGQLPDDEFYIVRKPYDLPTLLKELRKVLDAHA